MAAGTNQLFTARHSSSRSWRAFALAAGCLALASGLPAQRLQGDVVPQHYALSFTPDLAAERFNGEARIRLSVRSSTDEITLHAAGLTILSAEIEANGGSREAAFSTNPTAQTVTFRSPFPLKPGVAELRITYSGPLTRDLRGFYISESNGRKYAVTQLEATDARRMFPAFDEPPYKATFDIRATVDATDTAISNGAVESITPSAPGKRTFDFATTKPMASYLVALAVGDFECVHRQVGTTPLGVCATPGNLTLTRFALTAGAAALQYLNGYFEQDYPFGKLDLVAIPDFAAGAMENTGAVFFRESLLLVADEASLATRKRAALVVAHELAHMWFGNLVTMRWWDDLWLNEGFATWMETKAVAAWQPEWDLELDELHATHGVMAIDVRRATRSVRTRAETPAEIEALFDALAYEKAAAVIGMAESFAGERAWQAAINRYLQQHAYGNATAEDFWSLATASTGEPIDRVMRSFVDRPGVPLVSIEVGCRGEAMRVDLSQEPFSGFSERQAAWTIPVCFETRGDSRRICHLLDTHRGSVTVPGCATWLVGNDGAEGYYRTRHGADALRRLNLANAELAPDERLMLIADEWALMRAGRDDLTPFLKIVAAMAADAREPALLSAIADRLLFIREYLTTTKTLPEFAEWVRERFDGSLALARKRIEHTETILARHAVLLGLVGGIGRDQTVLLHAHRVVTRYLQSATPQVESELLAAYVGLAALTGNSTLYSRYQQRAESAASPEERYRFLYALAAFRDEALLQRTLDYARSDRVRAQDRAILIARVLANPVGRALAWQDVQQHWPQLQAGVGAFGGTTRIIEALGAFCDVNAARDIRAFFDTREVPGAARVVAQTIEDIEACAALKRSQQPLLDAALDAAR